MNCKYNQGKFWTDKYCFRKNFDCSRCPIKQEQELGNPLFSTIKRTNPFNYKELFFRDKLSIITTTGIIVFIVGVIIK